MIQYAIKRKATKCYYAEYDFNFYKEIRTEVPLGADPEDFYIEGEVEHLENEFVTLYSTEEQAKQHFKPFEDTWPGEYSIVKVETIFKRFEID